jgi:DNA polymerase-3 subunit epsilon
LATLKLFKLLLSRDSDKSIIKHVIRAESLGELTARQLDIVAEMPMETGVYYMYNKEGELIFLSHSTNIKKRVNQHFTNSGSWARTLQKETRKVTFEITGSELVARLKAEEERHLNRPRYNAPDNGRVNLQKQQRIVQGLYQEIDLANNSVLLIDKGRDVGERSAVLLKNGIFRGLGFYNLNHQINNIHILEKIITPMEGSPASGRIISTYLQEKRVLKVIELN